MYAVFNSIPQTKKASTTFWKKKPCFFTIPTTLKIIEADLPGFAPLASTASK